MDAFLILRMFVKVFLGIVGNMLVPKKMCFNLGIVAFVFSCSYISAFTDAVYDELKVY